jgi:ribosomal-protein-serine acetyltransferase
MNPEPSDLAAIDDAMAQLFAAFDNRGGRYPDMTAVRSLLLPEARIVRIDGDDAEVMDPESFVAPREARLAAGVFTEFHEWEERTETTIFGGAAVRRCTYRKAGLRDGAAFEGAGFKAVSFVKLAGRWRIASIVWQDDGEGLDLDRLAL